MFDVEGGFDNVCGSLEAVDLLHGGLQVAGGVAVVGLFEDGVDCVAETAGVEFASGDDDAGAFCGDACGYSGLVVA